MRVAVLGNPDSWYFHDLARAAGAQHKLVSLPFTAIRSEVAADGVRVRAEEHSLDDFEAVLVRTMPPGSLEQVVFRMDCLLQLEAAGGTILNPPRSLETAVDKFLTSAKLQAAGLPTPRTIVCQTWEEGLAAFAALGNHVVLKPIFGGEGRGLTKLDDEALAERAFKMLTQLGAVLYLQEFIPHGGRDLRLLVLGDRIWGMQRINPDDWRTNASRGARTEPFEVTSALGDLASRAAATVGAPFAGVDIVLNHSGEPQVLEVNAVPGWKALSRTLQVDIAAEVLEFTARQVAARQGTVR